MKGKSVSPPSSKFSIIKIEKKGRALISLNNNNLTKVSYFLINEVVTR